MPLKGVRVADLDILQGLLNKSTDPDIKKLNDYYDGRAMPRQLGLSLPEEMSALRMVLNYPRAVINAFDERLQIDGFRVAKNSEKHSRRFAEWWQKNNMDEQSSLGHVEALVAKRAFIVVGVNEDDEDTPLFTVESADSLIVDIDPRTKQVKAALRPYRKGGGGGRGNITDATLYLPNSTVYYTKVSGRWEEDPEFPRDDHNIGRVPVSPLVNRARLNDRNGRSEIQDILGLTDAACRSLTNLQAAQELLAVPQRYALGVSAEDFMDENGDTVSQWEAYIGRIFASKNGEATLGQFAAAELGNFTNTVMFYSRLVSAASGVPIRYLGIAGDVNGSSGDAIKEDDTKLIKRTERIAANFSDPWEDAMRIAARMIDGVWDPDLASLETIWRNPATPTTQSIADAAVKLYMAENTTEGPLVPRDYIWEVMGIGLEQRRSLANRFQNDPIAALLRMADENGPGDVQPGASSPDEVASDSAS